MDAKEMAQIITRLANESKDWFDLSERLKITIESQDSPLINFLFAFRYKIVNKSNIEYYDQFGPLGPIVTYENGTAFPIPVQMVDDDVLIAWDELFELTENPLVKSRLADLLWLRKWKERKAYLYAQAAIDSYCDVSMGKLEDTQIPNALGRALDISIEINDQTRKQKIISEIVDLWLSSERDFNHPPAMSLSFLGILLSLPDKDIPVETEGFIDQLILVYVNDPHILETLLTYKIMLVSEEEKKELIEKKIQIWVDEAEKNKEKGFVRHANLLHALELARDAGEKEVIQKITLKIQETPLETSDFHEFSFDLKIPEELVEKFFRPFRNSLNWEEGLRKFASQLPPSGNYENNREEIDRQLKENPLRFLVKKIIYDKNNLPIISSSSIEDSKEIALIRNETMMISGSVVLVPSIFKILRDKHGLPSSKKLIDSFTTTLISSDLAEVINESFQLYFNQEYKLASLLLVPVIESIIRETVRSIGLAVYTQPEGMKPSKVYGLGYLLHQLKERMDESWRRYIKNVLTEPLSFNLRNDICHGRLISPGIDEASLLIHIVCYLRLLEITHYEKEENDII